MGIRTSANTYRRGIPNPTAANPYSSGFYYIMQSNYVIPNPTSKFIIATKPPFRKMVFM